jgi:hypothetical protein
MAWLRATLRRMFWIILIPIMFLKILHQEMAEDGFSKDIEALLFEVIIIVILPFF